MARSRSAGRGGEFVLGERRGDEVVFLSPDRPDGRGVPTQVPFASDAVEPMLRALSGESGSMIGPDYRGVTVLAAYEPVALLDLGIVIKMDLAEIRAPFVRAALAVGALGLVGIALGTTLFFRVSGPMLDEIRAGERRFRDLFDNMSSGVAVLQPVDDGADFRVADFNRAAEQIDRTARLTAGSSFAPSWRPAFPA